MPIDGSVDAARRLVRIVYLDPFTLDEWRKTMDQVRSAPGFASGFRWLIDRRRGGPPDTAFARGVADYLDRHRLTIGAARVAILVRDVSTDHGMARMQEALNDFAGVETRAFKAEADAVRWLEGA